jgi:hypothetical protein
MRILQLSITRARRGGNGLFGRRATKVGRTVWVDRRCPASRLNSTVVSTDFIKLCDEMYQPQVQALPEVIAWRRLESFLVESSASASSSAPCGRERSQETSLPFHNATRGESIFEKVSSGAPTIATVDHLAPSTTFTPNQARTTIDAMLATFCLHVYARIASLCGVGFYTIGPCGEEQLASVALALGGEDDVALHYRHTAINIHRQLLRQCREGSTSANTLPSDSYNDFLSNLLLDRARGR